MSKLIFVTNTLTQEQIEFITEAETLSQLVNKFMVANPNWKELDSGVGYSVRVGGERVVDFKEDRTLTENSEVVIFPDIDLPIAFLPMLMAAMSTVGSVTGISGMVGGLSAMGMAAGMTGTAATLSAAGAATLGATGSLALAGAVTFVGGLATFATVVGGAVSMFSSHKPPGASGGGEGAPGEGSPKYGWNVQPSRSDGIPIPVIYGIEKVGGNIISKSTESTPTFAWDWFNTGDSGCALITVPLFPFSIFNVGLTGVWPPVRGYSCGVDPSVWAYLFTSIEILTYGDIKDFVSWVVNGDKNYFKTPDDYKNMMKFVTSVLFKCFRRTYWGEFLDARVSNAFNAGNKAKNIFTSSEFQVGLEGQLGQRFLVNPKDSDFDDYADYSISSNFMTDIKNWLITNHNIRRERSNRKEKHGLDLKMKWHIPLIHGDEFMQIFDDDASEIDNLGIYLTVACCFSAEAFATSKWWINDVYGLTRVEHIDGMDFRLFNFKIRDVQLSYENYLHELIALGEGECAGLKALYFDDLPVQTFPGVNYFFLPGKNTDTFLKPPKNFTEMNNYNNTVVSHSDGRILEKVGDYIDFDSTVGFPANNVHIRIKFNAYRMTLKGKIDDLDDTPITFFIMVGFKGTANFESYDFDNMENSSIAGNFIAWKYRVFGGMKDPFYRFFTSFPLVNFANNAADTLINIIPGAAKALANFLGESYFEGSPIDWVKYGIDKEYALRLHQYLQDIIDAMYINNEKQIHVRIIRASAHVNNNRYTDTMEVVGFDEVSYAGFDYPNLAKIGVKIRATDRLNSTEPNITAVVKGKKIWVPKLKIYIGKVAFYPAFEHCWFDEDIGKYRNCDLSLNTEKVGEFIGAPCEFATIDDLDLREDCSNLDFSFEYSNNNAWCVYDILTQPRYGLGNYIDKKDLPLNWFVAAGKHCDEMVPDGTIRWASNFDSVNSTTQQLADEDSTYFETERTYWDEDLNTFLSGQQTDTTDGNVFNETYSNKFGLINDYHGQAIFVESPSGGYTKTWVREYVPKLNILTATRIAILTLGADGKHPSWNYLVNGNYTRWTNGDPKVPTTPEESVQYMLARKRYTLNYVMDDSSSATDVIKQLCQTFRCFTIWSNNGIIPLLDKPEIAKTVIGMGNIIKDSMSIAYKSLKDVPNILECQFSNEELHYEKDVRQISDSGTDVEFAIDLMNIPRKKDVKLLGITNPAAILDELRYRLASEKKQTEIIQFSAGIDQINLIAGQVFTFAHDIMVGVGQSGRIIEYIPDGEDDWILIDQPLPVLDDDNLKIQVTFIVGEIEIQSEYSILQVDAANRAMVQVDFGTLKPQKFMPYIIGQTGTVSKDYRAISVVPAEDLAIQIIAIEYDESVYGTIRETPLGTVSYYDGTPIAAKNDRVTLLSAKSIYRPVLEAEVVKGYSSSGQLTLRVTFKRPFNILYTGCAITRKIGTGLNETLVTLPANDTIFVDTTANLPVNELISYYLVAQYVGGNFSNPVTVSILVGTDVSDSDLPYPETIKDLVLEAWCRKNFGLLNSSTNTFATRQFAVRWNKPGFVLPSKWDGDSQNKIDFYLVEINTYLEGSPTPYFKEIEVESYSRRIAIDYEIMGLTSKAQVEKVARVNISVAAVGTNDMQGAFYSEDFYPDDGLGSAKEVFHMLVPGGSIIWWKKPDDALDIDNYIVELTLYNKKHPEKRVTKTSSVKHEYCFFRIKEEDREALDIVWFAGLVAGYDIKITPTTVWGKSRQLTGSDNDDPDTVVDGEEGVAIPDWMLGSSAQNIELYDNISALIVRPNVTQMRNETWNFTKGLQTRINLLLDGKSTTGITYTGVGANVARIAYCSPTEGEYSSVYFNIDQPCYAWLEVLENREDGGLSEADAYYYYGSSDPTNYLASGGTLLYLGSGVANLTAAVRNRAWRVNTGNNYAKFPIAVNSRHLRLAIQPISGTTVNVSELRFCRRVIANEIITDSLSAITGNMGTLNAGKILFNIATDSEPPVPTNASLGMGRISETGVKAYNTSGVKTVDIDFLTGKASFSGGVSDTHSLESGGFFKIKNGATFQVDGDFNVLAAGKINLAASGEINLNGGALNINSGTSHWVGGEIHIYSGVHSDSKGIKIIPVDGVIKSANYSAGTFGAGYSFNQDGDIFAGNITSRGIIRCSVFEKDSVSAIAGSVFVPEKASTLLADITAIQLTLPLSTTAFSANEYVWAKDVTSMEAVKLVSVASENVWNVTRATKGTAAAWSKGTCFMKYSSTSASVDTGSIFLYAGDGSSVGPNILIQTCKGDLDPITGTTKKVVVGDLRAAPTTYFGALSGYGFYGENCYLVGDAYISEGHNITLGYHATTPGQIKFGTDYTIKYYLSGANPTLTICGLGSGRTNDGLFLGTSLLALSHFGTSARIELISDTINIGTQCGGKGYLDYDYPQIQIGTFEGTTIYGKLGFWKTPVEKQTTSNLSLTVVSADADAIYGTIERDMLNNMAGNQFYIYEKLNSVIDKLQAYGLF